MWFHSGQLVLFAVLQWCDVCYFLKGTDKKGDITVADGIRDILHGQLGVL